MKIHTKKKQYRQWLKEQAKVGKMNNAAGNFVLRASLPDNSMKRDYSPQS